MTEQEEMLQVSLALEKMGYNIAEYYDQAGLVKIYVDGEEKTLWQMKYLWKKK